MVQISQSYIKNCGSIAKEIRCKYEDEVTKSFHCNIPEQFLTFSVSLLNQPTIIL